MSPGVREWIRLLRSGEYRQIRHDYSSPGEDPYAYCALGLLQLVIDTPGKLWHEWATELDIPVPLLLEVYQMNNESHGFNYIASYLEVNCQ